MNFKWLYLVSVALAFFLLPTLPLLPSPTGLAVPPPSPTPQITQPAPPSHNKGFRPPLLDLSHLTGQQLPADMPQKTLPTRWDWRTQGKVTTVKNQGACGSCYAFAAIGNIESRLLIDGAGSYDFSENNAKECNWYEVTNTEGGTSCAGGNYDLLADLFSKQGVVLESCDPYVASDVNCNTTCPYQKTLLEWRIISGDVVPNPAVLKQYIYDYGPVYTAIYAGNGDAWDWEFGNYDGSYTLYYAGTEDPNHAVLIVGWDDNLSHAGGTGGWIAKNSWGTNWGGTCGYGSQRGYFTIAYGSASIGKYSSFMSAWQNYDSNGGLLYYDDGGWSASWGGGSTTMWGLARFVPASNTNATRVEFWTTDATTDVDIYIYDTFSGGILSNLLRQSLNHSFSEAGYHSVALSSPLPVTAGNDVIVVVKFTNQSYIYPLPIDWYGPSARNTYYSSTGNPGSWSEVYYGGQYYDVAIRLRTSTTVAPAPTVTSITPNTGQNTGTVHITNLAGTNFQAGATVKLTRSGQSDIPATNVTVVSSSQITCDFDLVGAAAGLWNVVVTNPDTQSGSLPNGFTVTTSPSAPTVTSITPSSGVCTGTVHITDLAGTNFQAGATVRLTRSGQPDIPATGVTVVISSQITCDFDLAGAAIGLWNVVVTNPDAQSGMLANGFTVLDSGAPKEVYLPIIFQCYPVGTPTLYPISNSSGSGTYLVEWSAACGATSYTLEEDDNASFSSPATRYTGSNTWYQVVGNGVGTYYYRVRACGVYGCSGWSNVQWTTVTPPLTDLYVQNDLGTTLHLTIYGVGSRDVPTGLYHWGTFPAGTYSWSATASGYYPASGTKTFPAGMVIWRFYPAALTTGVARMGEE